MALYERYKKEIRPKLAKELNLNIMEVPRIEKVVVHVGWGREALEDPKSLEVVAQELAMITGQKPVITRARKHVAQFKLRKGTPIGVKVTLRGKRAYDFLERLINFALPRVRDFRGLPKDRFDGRGSYNFGLDEHTAFPEVDIDKVQRVFGMDINIVTSADNDELAYRLLEALGFPFERD